MDNESEKHGHSCCCGHKHEEELHSCCGGHAAGGMHSCCSGGGKKYVPTSVKLWLSGLSLVAGFVLSKTWAGFSPLADPSWIAVALCGLPIFAAARNALEEGRIGAPTLVSLAMIATIALQFAVECGAESGGGHGGHGYIFAAGEIAFLMACGEALEERTVGRAKQGVRRLAELAPKTAFVKNPDGSLQEKPISELKAGDIVAVKPHSAIPADGTIVAGRTSVDQSNFTGESMPADKAEGDRVFAATTNLSGAIEVRVEKAGGDSEAGKLARLVEEAAGTRAPISRLANVWAGRLVVVALLASVAVFFIVKFGFGLSAMTALVRSATALVVFCPCAFVLATPTAIAATIGRFARLGVIVKSGAAIETLAKTDTLVFDKTGTLTKGEIKVAGLAASDGDARALARLAASAERLSEHPIAAAISEFAKAEKIEALPAENFVSTPGRGISCETALGKIEVCKRGAFAGEIEGSKILSDFEKQHGGETLVAVALDGNLRGLIALGDTLRGEAKTAVDELRALSIDAEMLTGDNEAAAKAVADAVGIAKFSANAMPADKFNEVERLAKGGRTVCMVGDGVNDAPALAAASVSVAMGKIGNDMAVENADITLLSDGIAEIPRIIKFSRKTMAVIKTNMGISLTVSALAITASAFGLLDPVSGALLHNLSSIFVVSNSGRLLGGARCASRRNCVPYSDNTARL